MPKKTTEQYIAEAKEKFGDKFDYSQTNYDGSNKNLNVICREHGMFSQIAKNHLNGLTGCVKCCKLKKYSGQNFIDKARQIHGDYYDYSNVKYVNSSTKVDITCPKHGPFQQSPHNHLKGYNCSSCALEGHFLSLDEIKERSNKVHNNKYDYSQTKYVNSKTKIDIICPIHDLFKQLASVHMKGRGCPKCDSEK